MVYAAYVPSDVHPAKSGNFVLERGSQSISSLKEVIPMECNTSGEISNLDDVQPIEVDTAISRTSATDDNAGKSFLSRKSTGGNYELVRIIANLEQKTEVLYPLLTVLGEHKKLLRIYFKYN